MTIIATTPLPDSKRDDALENARCGNPARVTIATCTSNLLVEQFKSQRSKGSDYAGSSYVVNKL